MAEPCGGAQKGKATERTDRACSKVFEFQGFSKFKEPIAVCSSHTEIGEAAPTGSVLLFGVVLLFYPYLAAQCLAPQLFSKIILWSGE